MNIIERIKLAKYKDTLAKELKKLAEDKDWIIREAVALNENAPIKILKKLACDKNREIRKSVLDNPNINKEIKNIVEKTNKSKAKK